MSYIVPSFHTHSYVRLLPSKFEFLSPSCHSVERIHIYPHCPYHYQVVASLLSFLKATSDPVPIGTENPTKLANGSAWNQISYQLYVKRYSKTFKHP